MPITHLYFDFVHWPEQLRTLATKMLRENMSDDDACILREAAEAFQNTLDNIRNATALSIEDPTPGICPMDEVKTPWSGFLGPRPETERFERRDAALHKVRGCSTEEGQRMEGIERRLQALERANISINAARVLRGIDEVPGP